MKKIVFMVIFASIIIGVLPELFLAPIHVALKIISHIQDFSILCIIIIIIGLPICFYCLRENYKRLHSDSKIAFWQILTNIFLVLFTFWMGIFVQDIIASKYEVVNSKLISFEYIDRISPYYKQISFNDLYSQLSIYADLDEKYQDKYKKDSVKSMTDSQYLDSCRIDSEILKRCKLYTEKFLLQNKKEIVNLSKIHDSIMAEYKYNLDTKMFDSISKINRMRNFFISVSELIEDSTKLDKNSYSEVNSLLGINDSLIQSKQMAYFEKIFTGHRMLYSGNPWGNYEEITALGCKYYNLSKQHVLGQLNLLESLAQYLVIDGQILNDEMENQRKRATKLSQSNGEISKIVENPIEVFIIFLALTLVTAVIITSIVSSKKKLIGKEAYDKLSKDNKDLIKEINRLRKELCCKKEECESLKTREKELLKQNKHKDMQITNMKEICA